MRRGIFSLFGTYWMLLDSVDPGRPIPRSRWDDELGELFDSDPQKRSLRRRTKQMEDAGFIKREKGGREVRLLHPSDNGGLGGIGEPTRTAFGIELQGTSDPTAARMDEKLSKIRQKAEPGCLVVPRFMWEFCLAYACGLTSSFRRREVTSALENQGWLRKHSRGMIVEVGSAAWEHLPDPPDEAVSLAEACESVDWPTPDGRPV